MAKSLKPYILTAIGLLVVSVGYVAYNNARKPAPAVETSVNETAPTTQETEQEVAAVDPDSESEASTAADGATKDVPTFSILRVEPDGSAVIGGSGPASSEIELFNGEVSLGKTTTGPEGDFAFVLDKPLDTGLHELTLSATKESGEKIVSAESGVVNVPEPGKPEELTVVVTEAGKASRVLSGSEPAEQEVAAASTEATQQTETEATEEATGTQTSEEATETEATQETQVASQSEEASTSESASTEEEQTQEVASSETSEAQTEIKNDVSEVEVNTETDNVSVSVKAEDQSEPAAKPTRPVLIEAADIEGGKLFIAGTGEPGMNVNLYMGSEFLGRTRVSENGAFLFEGNRDVKSGTYEIRADMTELSEAEVVARAQVKLLHEPETAAAEETVEVAKADDSEPATSESATATQTEEAAASTGTETATTSESATETEEQASTETASASQSTTTTTETQTASATETQEEAETVIRTGTAVIIRRGDNLWRLARRNYGAGIRYTTIFEANRDQIQDPNLIFPGQIFKVPEDDGTDG